MLLGLVATVMCITIGHAQFKTKEDARLGAAKTFVSFKNQLSQAFNNSKDYSSFEKNVCGNWQNTIEGRFLLNEAYNHLKNKTSDDRLITTYDGIGIAKALKLQQELLAKNPNSTGSELFGGPGDTSIGNYNPVGKAAYPCRWWQINCHLSQLFGEEAAGEIISIGIKFLISILIP